MRETNKQVNREYIVMIRAKEINRADDREIALTDGFGIF